MSQHPQIITHTYLKQTYIGMREYSDLMTLYMQRGDEITRLQSVIRNVTHYLIAKKDIGELSAVEEALLLECERAREGKA
jgi:hypothetical protein